MLLYNEDLRKAHWRKERFYDLFQDTKYSRQRQDFWDWIYMAETSGIKEFETCARHWSKGILKDQ